jgi:acylphosphatase
VNRHINITVTGRVQGVGFRRAARDQARFLGIKGFVKNCNDGTVYLEAEGDDAALSNFVKWCRQGPPFAHVEEINVESGEWKGLPGFDTKF